MRELHISNGIKKVLYQKKWYSKNLEKASLPSNHALAAQ
jgi:hypothetical protein